MWFEFDQYAKRTTGTGKRRVARYRNTHNGWFVDIDCRPTFDGDRFDVFYGPGVVFLSTNRREAFQWVRDMLKRDGFVAAPYDNGARARFVEQVRIANAMRRQAGVMS